MIEIGNDVENLIGSVFGELTVESYGGKMKRTSRWVCRCSCGNLKVAESRFLKDGRTTHCGCKGGAYHPLYYRHAAMIQRCTNPLQINYENYGGRGIKVCDRWNPSKGGSFSNFLEDMGECPKGMTLDRIDVNRDYTPENCAWVTGDIQHFNTRMHKTSKTGRTGVHLKKNGKYVVYITVKGVTKYLGTYMSFEEACEAREASEIERYGTTKL